MIAPRLLFRGEFAIKAKPNEEISALDSSEGGLSQMVSDILYFANIPIISINNKNLTLFFGDRVNYSG